MKKNYKINTNKMNNFIGKPVDFFKTSKKNIPVNMFRDNDKDGVANVFDCKPNNKNEQGLIDAIVGAAKGIGKGKGEISSGWRKGMAQEGNPVSRRYKQVRFEHSEKMNERFNRMNNQQQQRHIAHRLKREQFKKQVGSAIKQAGYNQITKIARAHPNYSLAMEFRGKRIKELGKRIKEGGTEGQEKKWKQQMRSAQNVQEHQAANRAKTHGTKVYKMVYRASESVFPTQNYGVVGGAGFKTIQGMPGRGRGRPRGSLDVRYARYGGVFGYRRYLSQMRKQQREQMRQEAEMMKQQRISQNMPQYEQQQYRQIQGQLPQEQQLPPEMQGQGVTPEYSQYQQYQEQPQQQVPQETQQYAPQYQNTQNQGYSTQPSQNAIRRPIATVFRGTGASPYPPVNRTPLAPSRSTIPYGYIEAADAFTGRRYLKQLPRKERWS